MVVEEGKGKEEKVEVGEWRLVEEKVGVRGGKDEVMNGINAWSEIGGVKVESIRFGEGTRRGRGE